MNKIILYWCTLLIMGEIVWTQPTCTLKDFIVDKILVFGLSNAIWKWKDRCKQFSFSYFFLYRISLGLIKLSIITSKEAMYCGCTQAKKAEVPTHQEHSDSPLQIKLVKMLGLKNYMLDKFVFRRKESCIFCPIQPTLSEILREGIYSTLIRKGTSPRPTTTSK